MTYLSPNFDKILLSIYIYKKNHFLKGTITVNTQIGIANLQTQMDVNYINIFHIVILQITTTYRYFQYYDKNRSPKS